MDGWMEEASEGERRWRGGGREGESEERKGREKEGVQQKTSEVKDAAQREAEREGSGRNGSVFIIHFVCALFFKIWTLF